MVVVGENIWVDFWEFIEVCYWFGDWVVQVGYLLRGDYMVLFGWVDVVVSAVFYEFFGIVVVEVMVVGVVLVLFDCFFYLELVFE